MTTILSDEVNFLVYRYLQESGYQHSAFSFGVESHISQSNINGTSVPPGALISILQKGIQFIEGELCINDDGSLVENLDGLKSIPLIDAVIPEALAERAATIYRLVSDKTELSKKSLHQNLYNNEEETLDGEVLLRGHKSEVFSSSWHPTSKTIATGAADGIVGVWKLDNHEASEILELDHNISNNKKVQPADVTSLTWHPDGNILATTSALEHSIFIWTVGGKLSSTLNGHEDLILSLSWNKKGEYLLSASIDKKCIIWDANNWQQVQVFSCHLGPVVDTDWLNTTTFASCSTDKRICVCRVGSAEPLQVLNGHMDAVNGIEWDPSGSILASCSDDRLVKLWNSTNSKACHDLIGHSKEVTQVKWNNRNILASASYDASVRLWNVEKYVCLHVLTHQFEPVNSITFHPCGQYLMSGSQDGLINLWSTQDGSCIHSKRSLAGIFEVNWSPDGSYISVCQADRVVKLIEFRKLLDR